MVRSNRDKMGVPELLDDYFKPHGNWEGMSLGWTTAVWVAHILSEGDHRMNQVQMCTGQEVSERGFSDDRLVLVLDVLSDGQEWQPFERVLNRQIIQVYDLKPQRVLRTLVGSYSMDPFVHRHPGEAALPSSHSLVSVTTAHLIPVGLFARPVSPALC